LLCPGDGSGATSSFPPQKVLASFAEAVQSANLDVVDILTSPAFHGESGKMARERVEKRTDISVCATRRQVSVMFREVY